MVFGVKIEPLSGWGQNRQQVVETMNPAIEKVRNTVRNLFNIRQKRRVPPVGTKPSVNTHICRGSVKMRVTHELDDRLWQWLALQNWRKITVPDDRRRYRHLPDSAFKVLLRAPIEELGDTHRRMLSAASRFPLRSSSQPGPAQRRRVAG